MTTFSQIKDTISTRFSETVQDVSDGITLTTSTLSDNADALVDTVSTFKDDTMDDLKSTAKSAETMLGIVGDETVKEVASMKDRGSMEFEVGLKSSTHKCSISRDDETFTTKREHSISSMRIFATGAAEALQHAAEDLPVKIGGEGNVGIVQTFSNKDPQSALAACAVGTNQKPIGVGIKHSAVATGGIDTTLAELVGKRDFETEITLMDDGVSIQQKGSEGWRFKTPTAQVGGSMLGIDVGPTGTVGIETKFGPNGVEQTVTAEAKITANESEIGMTGKVGSEMDFEVWGKESKAMAGPNIPVSVKKTEHTSIYRM